MSGKKSVLIIDDEENTVALMKSFLQRKGYTVYGATDGKQGVYLYKKERPDVCLIDIYMPDSTLGGLDVLKEIKSVDKKALCIILTYMGGEEFIAKCKELGAEKFLRKPVDVEILVKGIEEVLSETEGRRDG